MSLQETFDLICSKTQAKMTGEGNQFKGLCPAHDDHNPSLSVTLVPGDKILLKCWTDCQPDRILNALGLVYNDLFEDSEPERTESSTKPKDKKSKSSAQGPRLREVDRYPYEEPDGKPRFIVVRKEGIDSNGKKHKEFPQTKVDENGEPPEIWNMKGVKRLPYRLPQLLEAISKGRTVLLTEGEKDCLSAEALGFAATTLPGGAKKTGGEKEADTCLVWLKDADVILCPDNDETGLCWMQMLGTKLDSIAQRVRWLELPDLPEKGDLSDWIGKGGNAEALQRLIDEAPEFKVPELTDAETEEATEPPVSWLLYDSKSGKVSINEPEAAHCFCTDHPEVDVHQEQARAELFHYLQQQAPQANFSEPQLGSILKLARLKQKPSWQSPQPILELHQGQRPYPLGILPQLVRQSIEEVSASVQAPQTLAAQAVQSSLSFAAQGIFNVTRPTEQGELIGGVSTGHLTLAESSERKSTVDNAVMSFLTPEEQRIRERYEELYKELSANYEIWLTEYQSRKSALGKLQSKPLISDDDQINIEALKDQLRRLKETEPCKPPDNQEDFLPRLWAKNFSIQALARRLKAYPSMTVNSAEGGQTIGSYAFGRDQLLNTLGDLNELISSGQVRNDRVGDSGVVLEGARLTINVLIQPAAAGEMFSNQLYRDTGFLARLCTVQPQSLAGERWIDVEQALRKEKPSTPKLNELKNRLRNLIRLSEINAETGEISFLTLTLTKEAKEIWLAYYNQIEGEMGPQGLYSDFKDVAGKSAELAARLAAQFHAVEYAPKVELLENKEDVSAARSALPLQISADNMTAGIELARWYLDEFLRVFGVAQENQPIKDAQVILRWLQEHEKAAGFRAGSLLEVRTLRQSGPRPICRDAARVRDALDILAQTNHVQLNESTKGFKGNPAVFFRN